MRRLILTQDEKGQVFGNPILVSTKGQSVKEALEAAFGEAVPVDRRVSRVLVFDLTSDPLVGRAVPVHAPRPFFEDDSTLWGELR